MPLDIGSFIAWYTSCQFRWGEGGADHNEGSFYIFHFDFRFGSSLLFSSTSTQFQLNLTNLSLLQHERTGCFGKVCVDYSEQEMGLQCYQGQSISVVGCCCSNLLFSLSLSWTRKLVWTTNTILPQCTAPPPQTFLRLRLRNLETWRLWNVSKRCLKVVWKLFGRCLDNAWKVSRRSMEHQKILKIKKKFRIKSFCILNFFRPNIFLEHKFFPTQLFLDLKLFGLKICLGPKYF